MSFISSNHNPVNVLPFQKARKSHISLGLLRVEGDAQAQFCTFAQNYNSEFNKTEFVFFFYIEMTSFDRFYMLR